MNKYWLSALAALLLCVPVSMAIDRDAVSVETAALELMELDDADGYGLAVWGETAFSTEPSDWAVLLKVAYGEFSPIDAGSESYLSGALGIKYYILPSTSVAVIGDYTSYDGDRDAKMGTLVGKHRLISADEDVSPYITASVGIRDRSSFSSVTEGGDSFSESVFTFGAGVEFRMTEVLSFVLDAKIVEAEESDDGTEDLDGITGFVGLQYYFMPETSWR